MPVLTGTAFQTSTNLSGLAVTPSGSFDTAHAAATRITANFWVWLPSGATFARDGLLGRGRRAAGEGGWSVAMRWNASDGSLWAEHAVTGTDMGSSTYSEFAVPSLVPEEVWTMVTLDMNVGTSSSTVYINGVAQSATSTLGSFPASFSPMTNGTIDISARVGFYDGTNNSAGGRFFREVVVQVGGLTTTQITNLYNSGNAATPSDIGLTPDLYLPLATDVAETNGMATALTGTGAGIASAGDTGAPFEADLPRTFTAPAWVATTTVPDPEVITSTEVTAPVWSATTEVPTPTASAETLAVAPPWTPTTEVPTPATSIETSVVAPPWTPTTAVPTPTAESQTTLTAPAWASTTAVPSPAASTEFGLLAPAWIPTTTVPSPSTASEASVVAPSWTATTEVPAPTVDTEFLVTAPNWVPTTEVPTPTVSLAGSVVAPVWVPTTAVPTPNVETAFGVVAPPWAPTTTVPTPNVNQEADVEAPPWTPTTEVPTPRVITDRFVLNAPWMSSTAVPVPRVLRDVDFRIGRRLGVNTGGETVVFFGSELDMGACTPDFSDGSLDSGFWTDLSVGSGQVIEVPAISGLRLHTGATSGSVAGVRTQAAASDIDIEVQASVLSADPGAVSALELALYVSSATEFRLSIVQDNVRLTVTQGGTTTLNTVVGQTAGNPKLRLLRHQSTVLVFVGGRQVVSCAWVSDVCQVELRAQNSAVTTSQVTTRVQRYIRRPVILFGANPVTDLEVVSQAQARATTPPKQVPAVVDIQLTGCEIIPEIFLNAFEYYLDPRYARVSGQTVLTAVSDLQVSGRIGRSK